MQTKSLRTIQKLSKLGKILCKIIFILSLVGGIGCAVGILLLAVLPEGLKIGGMTLHAYIVSKTEVSVNTCYAAMAAGIVFCAGEAVLCRIAGRYFTHELEAGTPFTFEGAKEMMRLGVYTICIPIGAAIIAGIVYGVTALILTDVGELHLNSYVSIGLGVMFIFTGLLCRYGAEVTESRAQDTEAQE